MRPLRNFELRRKILAKMKIITLNVNGIKSAFRKGFKNWVRKENPDILCLQEIKSDRLDLSGHLYHLSINPARKKGYSGVAIASKIKPIRISTNIGYERFDKEGRIIEFEFKGFTLLNLYLPHGRRDKKNLKYKLRAYKYLLNRLKSLKNKKIILAGDFNIAHQEIDLVRPNQNKNNTMFTPEERKQIDKIIRLGFVDSFRKLNSRGSNYTWWPYAYDARARNLGWRLDYIFISKTLASKIEYVSIQKEVVLSDHSPYQIKLSL